MKPKPFALPRRPAVDSFVESLTQEAAPVSPVAELDELMRRREGMADELEMLDTQIERLAIESICGGTDESQDVETYDGSLGVTREFVDTHEPSVGQLQWLSDLSTRFTAPGESPGNVAGARWGSGCMITEDLYITAGHCFDQSGGGWQRPRRNGRVIEPAEIATLMQVNFNYQVNGQTGQLRPGVSFPILDLVEYRLAGLDFAIARLGPNGSGDLPSVAFGVIALAEADLTAAQAMLGMIQHPAGRPKKIEAGPMVDNIGGRIRYDSLDTQGGSSGSPILSEAGEVVGVHTNGGCSAFSGSNYGVSIGAIRQASAVIG